MREHGRYLQVTGCLIRKVYQEEFTHAMRPSEICDEADERKKT